MWNIQGHAAKCDVPVLGIEIGDRVVPISILFIVSDLRNLTPIISIVAGFVREVRGGRNRSLE